MKWAEWLQGARRMRFEERARYVLKKRKPYADGSGAAVGEVYDWTFRRYNSPCIALSEKSEI